MNEIIFAGAPYSNSAPLVEKLTTVDPRVRVISDHPANLVADLNAGKADVALIPVAHLFSHPELVMLDGLGIAADGPVLSVLLKCRVPVNRVKTVARDPASATSNALAEYLLRTHYGRDVMMLDRPGDPAAADAEVIIGDRALSAPPAPERDIDLAGDWKELTGLPFVFAVWAVRRDFEQVDEARRIALKACRAGLKDMDAIARRYAGELGRPLSFWHDYLGSRIHYMLDERDMEGLRKFKSCLQETGMTAV